MKHKHIFLVAISTLFALILVACGTPTVTPPSPSPTVSPSPSATPSSSPPADSTWVADQLGINWGNTPGIEQTEYSGPWRTADRTNLAVQSGTPWSWDRWSAFWYWIEQPHRDLPWGPGNFIFPSGDERLDLDGNWFSRFNLTGAATENQGQLSTLIVLDGIPRPYDCIWQGNDTSPTALCYDDNNERNERVLGLYLDVLLPDGSINSDNHWADYVYHTVNHFKQFGIEYYQAYNEPNIGYWNGGIDPDGEEWADDYARLVTVTLTAAQKAYRGAKVLLAASASSGDFYASGSFFDNALRYIENNDLEDDIEAFAIHSYEYPAITQRWYQWIQQEHPQVADRPVWITETGVALCADRPGTNPCVNTEEEQAAYIIQQFAYALTIDVKRVFHHRLADDCEADFGLYANDVAYDSGGTRVCEPTGDYTPRAAFTATKVIASYLQGGKFNEKESTFPSIETDYAKLVFKQPDQKVTVLWATKPQAVSVAIPISETKRVYWVDQANNWREITGQSVFSETLPAATATNEFYNDLPMVGGYTYLLIETSATTSAPTGAASLVCANGRVVGTALLGYDESAGLATLIAACSPGVIYDLSWTQPGRAYGGTVSAYPPVGGTCTLTLTNKAGLSIQQTLYHAPDQCGGGGGGGSAGGDHPDDNFSAAGIPESAEGTLDGDFFVLPEGARATPRVAILNSDFAHHLWRLVLELGEPADFIGVDFDPVTTAARYPVLLIPSGGLYGLDNDAVFRARLEEYTRQGGVIIAFAQQHGYEYAALPGGEVNGYGWNEDISCFQAALRMETWHPILAGFNRDTLTVHVDGYFAPSPEGHWPADAQVLLSRTANGQPGALLYPYPPFPPVGGDQGGARLRLRNDDLRRLGNAQRASQRRCPRVAARSAHLGDKLCR